MTKLWIKHIKSATHQVYSNSKLHWCIIFLLVGCAAWDPPPTWVMHKDSGECTIEASQRNEKWTCREFLDLQPDKDAVVITFAGENRISRHINSLQAQLDECKAGL